jgi:hypothetical protein
MSIRQPSRDHACVLQCVFRMRSRLGFEMCELPDQVGALPEAGVPQTERRPALGRSASHRLAIGCGATEPNSARPPRSANVLPAVAVIRLVEVEHVEEVPDRRHVRRNIGIVVVGPRIGQRVAAALAERTKMPISLHELHDG